MITSTLLRSSPERTFESLYRRHVKDVYRYCSALLDRQTDAEDATQTTFLNAYRAIERGERPRDAGAWLRAVALNVCREHYRRAGRRPDEVSLEDDPSELVIEPSVPEIGDVMRGLSCLPFNQRAALVMREFEGRSVAEIAASLEVSASAVEALLFRARRALREQLEEQLTCGEAERAISRQLDGALPRSERGPLRAHLRQCRDCAALARRVRAQRSAIRSLALLPLPAALRWGKLAGGTPVSAGAAPVGGSVVAKVATLVVAGAAIGAGYTTLAKHPGHTAVVAHRAIVVSAAARSRQASTSHGSRTLSRSASPVARERSIRHQSRVRTPATGRGHGSQRAAAARAPAASRHSGVSASAHSHRSPTGAAHRAPVTPASHGAQKLFKGSGHAYGRSAPKKTASPAKHSPTGSATAHGRLVSLSNKGHTAKP